MLYFARSAELAGLRGERLWVPRQLTALQLWEEIVRLHPRYSGAPEFGVAGLGLVGWLVSGEYKFQRLERGQGTLSVLRKTSGVASCL